MPGSQNRVPSPEENNQNYRQALEIIAEVSNSELVHLGHQVVQGAEGYLRSIYLEQAEEALFESGRVDSSKIESLGPIKAGDLCDVFGLMGDRLLDSGRAQWLGNEINSYEGRLKITNRSERQRRVTYVNITGRAIGKNRWPTTHELHFPSKDSKNRDFDVDCAVFVTHNYNESGDLIASHSKRLETIDPRDETIAEFLYAISGEYKQAKS
ncbi:MAG TPA: hypothetical protein VIJ68_01175 [Candidatus Saccharimonadales bacterium]